MNLALHLHQDTGQTFVARARVEHGVKPCARPQRALGGTAIRAGPFSAHQALKLRELLILDPLRGDPGAHAFERRPDLVDLEDVLDARLGDEAAALRNHLDETFRLEPPERLPHWRP